MCNIIRCILIFNNNVLILVKMLKDILVMYRLRILYFFKYFYVEIKKKWVY